MFRRLVPVALLSLLGIASGCRGTPTQDGALRESQVTRGTRYVSMHDIAYDLALDLNEREDGVVEMRDPPNSVIFVGEENRVWVNSREVSLSGRCMLRGDEYVVTTEDAGRIRDAFLSSRAAVVDHPPMIRVATQPAGRPSRESSILPAAWRPQAAAIRWQKIVIHHAAAPFGSARVIDRMHKDRKFDGLGYDFVVGNGTGSGDGEVEVGYRWRNQLIGAHARVHPEDDNWWNRYSIGIVLVGDFTKSPPTRKQMSSLVRLTRALMSEYGLDASDVVPHDRVKRTECPGRLFPWDEFIASLR